MAEECPLVLVYQETIHIVASYMKAKKPSRDQFSKANDLITVVKEEEGRNLVLIQTPSVEENAPLKAKNGVRLNYARHGEKMAEERPLVLVYQETPHIVASYMKAKKPLRDQFSKANDLITVAKLYQGTILPFKGIAWKNDDQEMVRKAEG